MSLSSESRALGGLDDFLGRREPARLLPREHDLAVDDHVELPLAAHLYFGLHTEERLISVFMEGG